MKLLLLVSFLSLWRRSDGTGAAFMNMLVKEGDDAILPCSFSSRDIRQVLFDWKKDKRQEVFMYDKGKVYDEGDYRQDEQFRGRVFHFPEFLDVGNAAIVIRATKLTDSGNYTCLFPHLHIRRSNVELVVGAAPKPSVKILDGTTDWALLQCEVHGAFPKPDVHWQNRAGDIVPAEEPQVSERGGRYNIILQTTVTKTDHYRCVSTQEEIYHQIYDETFVLLNDAGGTGPGWVGVAVGVVVGFAVGVVVGAVVVLLKKKTHSAVQSKSDQAAVDSSGNSGLDRFRPDSSVVTIRRRPLIQDTDSMTSGSDSS